MTEPVFIELAIQRESGDCTVACLLMLIGKSYQEVIVAAPPRAHKVGMTCRAMIETAKKLGVTLRMRRGFDIHEDTGILTLNPVPLKNPGGITRDEHVVLLLKGMVYDAYNGRMWFGADTFLRHERYAAGTLLTVEG